MDDVGLWTGMLDKLPLLASGAAAFLGGGAGSAITAGAVKSWQDGRRERRGALILAEQFADFLDGFGQECLAIKWRNSRLIQSDQATGTPHTVLPSITPLSEGAGWNALKTEVRQSIRAFQQLARLFSRHVDYSPVEGRELSDTLRDFNIGAAKLGLEAIRTSDRIRALYSIPRPPLLLERVEGIRAQLQQHAQEPEPPASKP